MRPRVIDIIFIEEIKKNSRDIIPERYGIILIRR